MWPFRNDDEPAESPEPTTANVIPIFTPPMPSAPPKLALPPAPPITNTIGKGSTVRGDLESEGSFRVEGRIEGTIRAKGSVIVEADGEVEGTIVSRDVVVHGRVRGNIQASGLLEVGTTGRIVGDIAVERFRVHDGGVFHGVSRMPGGEEGYEGERSRRIPTLPPAKGAVPPPAAASVERVIAGREPEDEAVGT